MAITITQIKNADLRQMATNIDNGDGKINHQELQDLISGVAKLQTERFEQKVGLDKNLEETETRQGIREGRIVLGAFVAPFAGGAITKSFKGIIGGCVLSLGALIYNNIKSAMEKNEIKDNKEALKNDENLNTMAAEVKELVSQMAGGNEQIASYLADHDGGEMDWRMNAKTWNNYTTAVYGNLRNVWHDEWDMTIKESISENAAKKSLDKHDAKMAEIKNED